MTTPANDAGAPTSNPSFPPPAPLTKTPPMCGFACEITPKNGMIVKHANVYKRNLSHRRADAGSTGQPSSLPTAPQWTWRQLFLPRVMHLNLKPYLWYSQASSGEVYQHVDDSSWAGGFAQVGVCRRHSRACSILPWNLRDLCDPLSSSIVQNNLTSGGTIRDSLALSGSLRLMYSAWFYIFEDNTDANLHY